MKPESKKPPLDQFIPASTTSVSCARKLTPEEQDVRNELGDDVFFGKVDSIEATDVDQTLDTWNATTARWLTQICVLPFVVCVAKSEYLTMILPHHHHFLVS